MNGTRQSNGRTEGQLGTAPYSTPMPARNAAGGDNLFQIIWAGRWFLLFSLMVAGAGAYGYLQLAQMAGTGRWAGQIPDRYLELLKPKYRSVSRIIVDKPSTVTPVSGVPQVAGVGGDYLEMQAQMMTSPAIVNIALKEPRLAALSGPADAQRFRLLIGSLSASVKKDAGVITISAESSDPNDASALVGAVMRAYMQWHADAGKGLAQKRWEELEEQRDGCVRLLQQRVRDRNAFEAENPGVVERLKSGRETAGMLGEKLVDAQLRADRWKTYCQELDKLRDQPGEFRRHAYACQGAGAASSEDPERMRLETDLYLTEMLSKEVSAGAARNSQVDLYKAKIAEIKDRLAESDKAFVRNHAAWAQARAVESNAEVAFLTGLKRDAADETQRIMGQESSYGLVVSEVDILQKQYDSILAQIGEISSLVRFEGPRIHILQEARPATAPSSPQAAYVIGIALGLGAMVGAGLSLVRDWTDQRLRSAEEIMAILGVPILGAVPSMARRQRARSHRLCFASNSRESEAYRVIRTALLHGTSRAPAVTILVTSPGPLEGKTTLVSNLAIAMAYAGQHTLIIDADLRKPMPHHVFAASERGLGLADVLAGKASLAEAIRSTEIERLDILPCGHNVVNPSELLSNPRFADSLHQLRNRYDQILVDSPPVGVVTDAQILATLCDLTLLVLRAEKTSRLLTQRTRDALDTVGATVVGAVVNDVRRKDTRYSQFGVHGYSYHGSSGGNGSRQTPEERRDEPALSPQTSVPEQEAE